MNEAIAQHSVKEQLIAFEAIFFYIQFLVMELTASQKNKSSGRMQSRGGAGAYD